ncbi:haloacid dehalogenase-like hydrolase [Streptomyces sp. NPDC017993]|uniref:haloacid dehalogenase-like hydrolase n=1 Tax=Streptomyces sp. NPDC017993 TaxID=3365027 RepID=UPI00379CD016
MRNRHALALGLTVTALLAGSVPATAAASHRAAPAQGTPAARNATHCPQLSKDLTWYGHNRAKLQRAIDERGTCSNPGLAGGHGRAPVAAFDWDNTMTKNDVTDATIDWSLLHDKILRPAHWSDTSKWLTPAADRALTTACGTSVPVGAPLPTATDTDCADEILEIRAEARTMGGEEAFAGTWNHRRTVPEYAWVPQLFAGHTEAELRSYAAAGRKAALAAPVGSTQKIGTHTQPAYVRYYDQQKDLVRTLRRAGFDVYIVSAGSEPVTEVWSQSVGFDRDHTIAIRSLLDHGKITYGMQGCGDVPESQGDAIPYIDGKRCWINQEIFHIKGAEAWRLQDPAHRIALGGGDADTDVTFVNDATAAHLAINRNKNELMCRGYDNADDRWVVNPMFIEPLPRKSGGYPCATAAYINTDGVLGPVRRPDGTVVPDQRDRIHG